MLTLILLVRLQLRWRPLLLAAGMVVFQQRLLLLVARLREGDRPARRCTLRECPAAAAAHATARGYLHRLLCAGLRWLLPP